MDLHSSVTKTAKTSKWLSFNKSLYLQAVLVLLGMDDFDELPPNFSTDVG